MTCHELARRLLEFEPDLSPTAVARMSLLLLNQVDNSDDLLDDDELQRQWKLACIRLQAATDQHAAMTNDLECLAANGPVRYEPAQVWTLFKALKVQSQLLELYLNEPVMA